MLYYRPTRCQSIRRVLIIIMLLNILLLSSLFFSTITCGPVKEAEPDKPIYRLPTDMIATDSDLSYVVSLSLPENFNEKLSYKGAVDITFKPAKRRNSILIHYSGDIEEDKITLREDLIYDEDEITIKEVRSKKVELYEIVFEKEIDSGKQYTLSIEFTGKLDDKSMYGFYLSKYGKDGYLATTQFEPTYARRAFPCFDEPSFKATFEVKIEHPEDFHALSNTEGTPSPIIGQKRTETKFKKTAKIATYLIAFVVSTFKDKQTTDPNYKIHAREDLIKFGDYAALNTPKVIKELKTLLGGDPFELPMRKVDQVAIPDFAAGAMENWGIVTYREQALLFDEENGNEQNRQSILTVIAHELAHFWFGNLVTLDWWANTWLNEGFARYFEYHGAHKVEPSWELDKQFVIEQQQTVFREDALDHAEPLSSDVNTASEISNKFGHISYNKGASVLRMMFNVLGNDVTALLKPYLDENKFKNSSPDILFAAIQKVLDKTKLPADMELKDVMKNWFYEPGFPVLKVVKEKDDFVITQKKFKGNPADLGLYDAPKFWNVPLRYKTSKVETVQTKWLTEESTKISHKDAEWILLNLDAFGYYRVNYDDALWKEILKELNKEAMVKISVMHRSQLVDDAMNLARANELKYETALNLLSFLKHETSYYPWYSALKAFTFLQTRLDGELLAYFNTFITDLMAYWYDSIIEKYADVSLTHLEQITHTLAHEWACKLNNKKCVDLAKTMFGDGTKTVAPNDRSFVYCTVIREDSKNFDLMLKRIVGKDIPELPPSEQQLIISSLGCSKEKGQLKAYLELTITDAIRKQDAHAMFNAVLNNPIGVDVCMEFVAKNPTQIKDYYGGFNAIYEVSSKIGDKLTNDGQLKKLEEFMKAEDVTGADAILTKAKTNLNWTKYFKADFEKIFIKKTTTTTPKPNSANILGINTALLFLSSLLFKYLL